jgi:hypothetical protein
MPLGQAQQIQAAQQQAAQQPQPPQIEVSPPAAAAPQPVPAPPAVPPIAADTGVSMSAVTQAAAAAPPVVVVLDLDDLPEPEYPQVSFRLQGITYVLHIQDAHVLVELAEFGREEDLEIDEVFDFFFDTTFHSAFDANGVPVVDGLNHLKKVLRQTNEQGQHVVSLTKTSRILMSAVETWSSQLSDTSMRPERRRKKRRDRR